MENETKPAAKITAPKAPEPNMTLTARDSEQRIDVSKALKTIRLPHSKISLPDPHEQNVPFYHEKAAEIIAAMPHLYKTFKADKGK